MCRSKAPSASRTICAICVSVGMTGSFSNALPWPKRTATVVWKLFLYGDWGHRSDHINWACRIATDPAVLHNVGADPGIDVVDGDDRDGRDDQVVLVEVVETVEAPQSLVPSVFRSYLFENKFRSTGEGLLYRREMPVGYEVFFSGCMGKNGRSGGLGCHLRKMPAAK
jgi:hypothetical protein